MHSMQKRISEASFDFKQMASIINILNDNCKKFRQFEIPDRMQESMLEKVVAQYYDHVVEYGISVRGVCPYKILAWSGYILAQELWKNNRYDAKIVLIISILIMTSFLKKDGITVCQDIKKKLIKMICSELNGKVNLGIGMNGFYMIFRVLSYQKS